jgi:hypothetical protein
MDRNFNVPSFLKIMSIFMNRLNNLYFIGGIVKIVTVLHQHIFIIWKLTAD